MGFLKAVLWNDYSSVPEADPVKVSFPAFGVSHYLSLTDPQVDAVAFAQKLASVNATMTRAWLCDPWAAGTGETGCYNGYNPVRRRDDGMWDLNDWDEEYFVRLKDFTNALWAEGIWPQYTFLNLYQFSPRKQGLIWVPDMNQLMWRKNVNDVRWGDPDEDVTFFALPDWWMKEFIKRVVDTLGSSGWAAEIANEMPEKEMHERIADHLRSCGFTGEITVNRNEDSPGQYANMRIADGDGRYQRIAFHGKETGWLDEVFDREPVYKTFRQFFASDTYEANRIIWSGDGVGKNSFNDTYDEDEVEAVVRDAAKRGLSIEWQAREWKLGRFLLGRFSVDDLYVDFTKRLAKAFYEEQ